MPSPRRFINRAIVHKGAREERARRMAQIAQTAWGQAWLQSLRQVDHENRLGRGLELARQGAVADLHFETGGIVKASVRGTQPQPYRTQLSLKPFTATQTQAITAEVARRPEWLDLLFNGQLPQGIEQVLAQAEVRLFPTDWRDLDLRCTCPDAAVPCKHLAATLYQLAADIDENPTLLFSMRGLALEEELRSVSEVDGLAPTALRDLRTERAATGLPPGRAPSASPEGRNELSTPSNPFLDIWALLLPARPPFFKSGNLAELYVAYLRTAAEFWRTSHDDDSESSEVGADSKPTLPAYGLPDVPAWRAHHLRLDLDAAGSFLAATLFDAHDEPLHAFTKEVALLSYLERLASDASATTPVASGVVVRAFRLARKLVVQGAVVPRLLSLGGDDYRVRWGAATQDATVAESVRRLAAHLDLPFAIQYLETVYEAESEEAFRARLAEEIGKSLDDGEQDLTEDTAPSTDTGDTSGGMPPPRQLPVPGQATQFADSQARRLSARNDERAADAGSSLRSPRLSAPSAFQSPEAQRPFSPTQVDAPHALLGALLRPMLLAGVQEVLAQAEHAAVQLLFLGRPVNLSNTGDTQLALAMQLWLRRLSLDTSSHRLLLQVDELFGSPGRYALRPLLVLEAADAPAPIPLPEVIGGSLGELMRLQVLRDMALLAEGFAPLGAFADTQGGVPEYIELYGGDFAKFLFEVAPALRLVGAQVLMPHGLELATRPKLSAVVVEGGGEKGDAAQADKGKDTPKPKGLLGLNSLVAFDWQVAVGDDLISADEFADLTDKYEGIVRLRDGFVWLEPLQTARLLQRLANPPQPSAAVTLQSVLAGGFQGAPLFLSAEVERLRQNLLDPTLPGTVNLPGLKATLRPYQIRGFHWLLRNAEAGLGSLLADDMGLGKTLQTIALLEHYRVLGRWQKAPALIVLPTSLITNWTRELARFAPELNVVTYHGPNRKLRVLAKAEVVLTSYGIVRSDVDKLVKLDWGAIIIDEAQQIKNPGAAQSEAVKRLDAPIKLALSGTPVENRLSEYWSVLDFANPGYLGPLIQFKTLYADPIERDRDGDALERFRQITAPFILRRLKTDRTVIADLPDKITQVEPCHLEPEQAALYQQVVETQLRELAAADETMRRARMLKFMTAVKQVCNHPYHYLKRGSQAAEASGKAQRLLELTEAALANEERVLIFTQYRQMGELLADMLRERFGYRPPFLHGGLQREERDAMVTGMQDGTGAPILILSIKAGGTGLNLTAANHVIHYDLWWNPAVETQATDRAFRIGQARNVHVHRLITAGTFEERIDLMLSQKRELAELTVGSGGAWLGDLAAEVLAGR